MIPQRVRIGRDVRVVTECADGVELEGPARLRPGSIVEVHESGEYPRASGRPAVVWYWRVILVDAGQIEFRGFCRWVS